MAGGFQDLRDARRALTSAPGTTIFAVLTFAVAIGGNTALFSLMSAWLLRPLPYHEPERLVVVRETRAAEQGRLAPVAPADFLSWREDAGTFESIAAYHAQTFDLTGMGEPEQVEAARAAASLFTVLGVEAVSGRTFRPDDEVPGAQAIAVASDAFWRRRFGAAPFAPRTIVLDGRNVDIVGVMPPSFEFPKGASLWVPLILERGEATLRRLHYLQIVGRLRAGVSLDSAQRRMDARTRRLEQDHPENRGHHSAVGSLTEATVGTLRLPLLFLQAATGFVLLLACASIATLLLARSAVRQTEIAVRRALGAGRLRLLRQLLVEGLMLASAGGVAGVLAAVWLVPVLRDQVPAAARPVVPVAPDARVLAFAIAITAVAGVVTALAPSLHASIADPWRTLSQHQSTTSGSGRLRLTRALVALEVALAVVLLAAAGLTATSFARLRSTDPGFQTESVLTASLSLPRSRYAQGHQVAAFYQSLLDRLSSTHGVVAAGAVLAPPGSGSSGRRPFTIERAEPTAGERPSTLSNVVTPGYFRALGIPLVRGRSFEDADASGPPVVIVNERWAARHMPGGDPLTAILRFSGARGAETRAAVVGVVGDVRQAGLFATPEPEIYLPHAQTPSSRMTIVVRRSDAGFGPADVRSAVWSIDRDQPVSPVEQMARALERDLGEPRLRATLLGAFAVSALALAVIGVVGLASASVKMRTAEIAIRVALGAQPSAISRLVVGHALRSVAIGAAAGTVLALWMTRVARGLFAGAERTDAAVVGGVLALLTGCALLATYVPARRAARLDPIAHLRGQGHAARQFGRPGSLHGSGGDE